MNPFGVSFIFLPISERNKQPKRYYHDQAGPAQYDEKVLPVDESETKDRQERDKEYAERSPGIMEGNRLSPISAPIN